MRAFVPDGIFPPTCDCVLTNAIPRRSQNSVSTDSAINNVFGCAIREGGNIFSGIPRLVPRVMR